MGLKKYLFLLSLITPFIFPSCDMDEIKGIEDIKVKTEARVVVPLAYGSIELQNIINFISPDDSIFPIDEKGFITFDPFITEIEFPTTFAFNGSLLNSLSHLELRIETENRLPLGLSFKLSFVDSMTNTEYGDPIRCDSLLKPAIIDQFGKVIQSMHNVETVILDNKLILEYQKANAINADIRFFLPEAESGSITVNQKDFLSLNVGVVVHAKTIEN